MEFNYVVEGEVDVHTVDGHYRFKENEGYFTNANVLCKMDAAPGSACSRQESHLFHPIFIGGHFKSVFETKYMDPVLKNRQVALVAIRGENERQKKILAKLRRLTKLQQEQNTELLTRNLLSEIWMLLMQEIEESVATRRPTKIYSQERIQTMLSYVHQHYGEKVTVKDIADSAAVSKRECLRCFRECIEKSPIEYLMDYRIGMAEKLLSTTEDSISDIAIQVGFTNSAYLGKVFREKNNQSPKEWRKQFH